MVPKACSLIILSKFSRQSEISKLFLVMTNVCKITLFQTLICYIYLIHLNLVQDSLLDLNTVAFTSLSRIIITIIVT